MTTGDTGAIRAEARAAVDTIVKTITEPAPRDAAREPRPESMGATPAVGDRVTVGGLGLEAVVTAIHDGTAELDVRGKRMRASVRDLRVIAGAPAVTTGSVKVHFDFQPREASATDLNVIGCTVDEAISRAERFLDESLLTDQADGAVDSRLRYRPAQASAGRISAAAPARSALRSGASGAGRRRGHGRGAQGLTWACSPRRSSTT